MCEDSCYWTMHCRDEKIGRDVFEFCDEEGVFYDLSEGVSPGMCRRTFITNAYKGFEGDIFGQLVRLCLKHHGVFAVAAFTKRRPNLVVYSRKSLCNSDQDSGARTEGHSSFSPLASFENSLVTALDQGKSHPSEWKVVVAEKEKHNPLVRKDPSRNVRKIPPGIGSFLNAISRLLDSNT